MWDKRYSDPDYVYGQDPNTFLAQVAARIPDGPVLSLGEGEGRNAAYLASLGHPVTAVDQSAVGLAKAARLAGARGLTIQTVPADLALFTIEPAAWAAIVSISCHLPSAIRVPLHRAVVAGLQPGGVFILEAYTPAQLGRGTGGPENPDMMPTLADLRRELPGLDFTHAAEIERDVTEGRYHTGRAAVVQIVARRPPAK